MQVVNLIKKSKKTGRMWVMRAPFPNFQYARLPRDLTKRCCTSRTTRKVGPRQAGRVSKPKPPDECGDGNNGDANNSN